MTSLFEFWEDVDKLAKSDSQDDRIFAATMMKELHELGNRLIRSAPDPGLKDGIRATQEKIRKRIEAI